MRWGRFFVALLVAGCGSSDDAPPPSSVPPEASCELPARLVGDACIEPGFADDGCPAGTLGREDGSCDPAGVQPGMCGEGFVHDGDVGCEPILPPEPCTFGLMAVPGERTCRPVMPCGQHKWGNIPVDATTEYVDGSYSGSSDGSATQPWTTIEKAVEAAAPGAIVAIAAGTYVEELEIHEPVRLWGVCPDKVAIVGSGAAFAVVDILPGAADTEVRGVAITGGGNGLGVTGAQNVRIEGVWVHDTELQGVGIDNALGATEAHLTNVLVEDTRHIGVFTGGADVTIESSVIRDTVPHASDPTSGRGVEIESVMGAAAIVTMRNCIVERSTEYGVFVGSSEVTIEGSVIRYTSPPPAQNEGGYGIILRSLYDPPTVVDLRASLIEHNHDIGLGVYGSEAHLDATVVRATSPAIGLLSGRGINIQSEPARRAPSIVSVTHSLVEKNHEFGVFVGGSELDVESTVIRDTSPRLIDDEYGRGLSAQADLSDGRFSVLSVRGSLIERSHEVGLFVGGADAAIESTVVRDVSPRQSTLVSGRGISFQPDERPGTPSSGRVLSSLVERVYNSGVYVSGSDVTIESTAVRDVMPQPVDLYGGRGINIQRDMSGTPALAAVRTSLVERCFDIGIFVDGTDLTLESSVVRDVWPRQVDGNFGDGVAIFGDRAPASAIIQDARVENSPRGAIAIFGASLRYGGTVLLCHGFDLIGEAFAGYNYSVENLGDNRCGCPGTGECILESAGFEPPQPLE